MRNKVEFDVSKDGVELKLAVVRPSHKVQAEAQLHYAKAFADLVKAGALLRQKLDQVARDQKLWDDARQAEWAELLGRMAACERKVPDERGEVAEAGVTVADARKAAIQLRKDRAALQRLLADRSALEANTAERLAEDARFNFYVGHCTVHAETGKPYFKGLDDYTARAADPDGRAAAEKFAALYYSYDEDYEKKLPENVFLRARGFCNDNLELTDKQGRLVDEDGEVLEAEPEKPVTYRLVDDEPDSLGGDGEPGQRVVA